MGPEDLASHDLVARAAPAARRMRREVLWSHIGLDLDEAAPHEAAVDLANEHLAEQVPRDGHGFAVEKRGIEDPAPGRSVRNRVEPLVPRLSCVPPGGGASPRTAPCRPSGTWPASPCPASRPRSRR